MLDDAFKLTIDQIFPRKIVKVYNHQPEAQSKASGGSDQKANESEKPEEGKHAQEGDKKIYGDKSKKEIVIMEKVEEEQDDDEQQLKRMAEKAAGNERTEAEVQQILEAHPEEKGGPDGSPEHKAEAPSQGSKE